jgi:hypothetical protein
MEAIAYSFEAFREDIKDRVLRLNALLKEADAVWPGVLFLDVPTGLDAEAFELAGISAAKKEQLALHELPELLVARGARRFCWLMPAWRLLANGARQECLVLVFGERGRCEVAVTSVFRRPGISPRLGRWEHTPCGAGTDGANGLFVDPMMEAIASVPPWLRRREGRG